MARGWFRGGRRRSQMDHSGQLEIRGREFLRRHLSQPEPPLGRPDRHRPSSGKGRNGGKARQRVPGAGSTSGSAFRPGTAYTASGCHPTRPMSKPSRTTKSLPLFPALLPRAAAPARRQGAPPAVHRHDLPKHVVSRAPARALCVWHPVSATQTEVWRFFLVDRDAPAEVKELLRRYYMRYSGRPA